jgi:predicted TIM-barrel fold metal-dependent hydrolase
VFYIHAKAAAFEVRDEGLQNSMIMDALTHVTPDGRWFHTGCDASESRLLRELEITQVDQAVVVPLAGYIANEFVLDVCQRRPDRLVPGASFNPTAYSTAKRAAVEFRSQLQASPFRLLKLHPRLNQYDPLDPRCLAVLEELACWKDPLPVWIDTLFYYPGGSLRKSIVDTIHDIVGKFMTIKFVLLHAGGSWALQVAEAIQDYPNAFLDISFTLFRFANSSVWMDLRYLLESFDRRMVFGSDFPEISIGTAIDYFNHLADGISQDKRDNILGRNLCTLLSKE